MPSRLSAYWGMSLDISSKHVVPLRIASTAPSSAMMFRSSGVRSERADSGNRSVVGKPKSSRIPRSVVARRCVCAFTRPGKTAFPRPSTIWASGYWPVTSLDGPTATILVPSTATQPSYRTFRAMSPVMTVAFLMRVSIWFTPSG